MTLLVPLFFSLSLLLALPAFAQTKADSSPYSQFENGPAKSLDGILGTKKKLPPVTPEQIDEALGIYDQCEAETMVANFYDCDCLSSNFLEMRRGAPDEKADTLNENARKICANKTFIAGTSYNGCIGWASDIREDYREYCTCYANSFANTFAKGPTDSIRGRQVMMTNALNSCQSGTEIANANSLERVIEYLKKSGLYKTMFPGSVLEPLPSEDDETPPTP